MMLKFLLVSKIRFEPHNEFLTERLRWNKIDFMLLLFFGQAQMMSVDVSNEVFIAGNGIIGLY